MEKTFNLEAFKNGEKAVTKSTKSVAKFICETRGKMLISIQEKYGFPYIAKYNLDGKKYTGTESPYDLEMIK